MNEKYTNRIYGVHASFAFGLPCVILLALVMMLTGCVSIEAGFTKRDVPLTCFYTYLPYAKLEVGATDD